MDASLTHLWIRPNAGNRLTGEVLDLPPFGDIGHDRVSLATRKLDHAGYLIVQSGLIAGGEEDRGAALAEFARSPGRCRTTLR